MRQQLAHQVCIVLAAGAIFLTNLGATKLWDRDEPRNAGCAAEMLRRGDWVVPVFNAELRPHKPVLLYWLIMTAYRLFGVSEFSARLWSALLGVGTVLATYHIGRRMFNAKAGLWGALILSSCLMFDVLARAATPDSTLIFFATSAMLVYVLGTFAPSEESESLPQRTQPRQQNHYFPAAWAVVALMYGAMGMAVLAKGPVGLVLPTAVIGMFLLIMRLPPRSEAPLNSGVAYRWCRRAAGLVRPFAPVHFLGTCWLMRPITALAVVLAVALPWYVLVSARTSGDWLEGFVLTHNLGRATQAMEGHGGSILYYPVALVVGFFPWSVFLVPTLIGAASRIRRGDPWHAGYVLLACWAGVYVGLFSVARTKLPNYITPAYPACALLTGCFLYHWTRGRAAAGRIWVRLALASLAAVGVGLLVGLPLAARRYLPSEEWLGAIGLIPILGAAACFLLLRGGRLPQAAAAFAATAVLFVVTLFGFAAVRVDRHQQNTVLVDAIAAHSVQPQIASFGVLEPSWVYYAGRPIREIHARRRCDAQAFLQANENAFLITTEDRCESLKSELPGDVTVLARAPYFLKKGNLVVIGRRAPAQDADHVASRVSQGSKTRR